MTDIFNWYQIITDKEDIQQGDFIDECPILIPPKAILQPEDVEAKIEVRNVIIMSQSCDINKGGMDVEVLLCPYTTLIELERRESSFKQPSMKELLRRGYIFSRHLLNKCVLPRMESDFIIVDFRSVYSTNINVVKEVIALKDERKRLLPPYREHLSQAFARYFMRVGLPEDIPSFDSKLLSFFNSLG